MNKIFHSHKSIIFLNGSLPNKNIMNLINTDRILLAADGASSKMAKYDLIPNYIIGDFDSKEKSNCYANKIKIQDQDTTDFEKCILFAREKKLFPCLVLGINGGEIDHILGNMQVILKHCEGQEIYFLDTYRKNNNSAIGLKLGIPLINNFSINLELKSTISIISFDEAIVSSKGLEWELEKKKLNINDILALRNQNLENTIEFEILNGKAIVIFDITQNFQINKSVYLNNENNLSQNLY